MSDEKLLTYRDFVDKLKQQQCGEGADEENGILNRRNPLNPFNKKRTKFTNQTIYLQTLDWHQTDANLKDQYNKEYLIKAFGVDKNGKSYTVNIKGFKPYLYVKPLFDDLTETKASQLMNTLQCHFNKDEAEGGSKKNKQIFRNIFSTELLYIKDLYHFKGLREEPFFKFTFKNYQSMKSFKYFINQKNEFLLTVFDDQDVLNNSFKIYEGNLDPYLRFMHIQNIVPSGWIKLPKNKYQFVNDPVYIRSKTTYEVEIEWENVQGYDSHKMAPFLVASFDIECISNENRFPLAKKDWDKVSNDVVNDAQNLINVIKSSLQADGKNTEYLLMLIKNQLLQDILYAFEPNNDKKQTIGAIQIDSINKKENITIKEVQQKIEGIYDRLFSLVKGYIKTNDKKQQQDTLKLITKEFEKTFPKTKFVGDPCIQIGTTLHNYGEDEVLAKYVFTLDTCSEVPESQVYQFATEKDMLRSWGHFIRTIDPDVLTGYNIMGFDFKYVYERSQELGMCEERKEPLPYGEKQLINYMKNDLVNDLSRLELEDFSEYERRYKEKTKDEQALEHKFAQKCVYELVKHNLSSSALGNNEWYYTNTFGRVQIDVMKVIQKDYNLESYKLDNVAYHFMNERKDDISPKQITAYQFISADHRAQVAKYCVQDCALCNRLMIKLEMITNNIGMSNVCRVPISFLFLRGQSIKIYSLVAQICREYGFVIPDKSSVRDDNETEKYEGAIVLQPKIGLYLDVPVSVLDYGSLYPSSMIAENISHDTFVLEDEVEKYEQLGYKINRVKYESDGVPTINYYVTEDPKGNKIQGLMPIILQNLLTERKNTRKKIGYKKIVLKDELESEYIGLYKENEDKGTFSLYDIDEGENILEDELISDIHLKEDAYDKFRKNILNSHQLALKISANSLYGQCGSRFSPIGKMELAASTTAIGRQMLLYAKDYAQQHFGAEIIYGDSVSPDTPLLIKYPDETIDIVRIDELPGNWQDYPNFLKEGDNKQKIEMQNENIQIWCHDKWTQIKKVIRHKTNKKMYRIVTRQGVTDITEDHSLLNLEKEPIKPSEIVEDETEILHGFPTEFPETDIELNGFTQGAPVAEGTKQCSKCQQTRTMDMFYKARGNTNRYVSQCKICVKQKYCETNKKPFDGTLSKMLQHLSIQPKTICEKEAYVMGAFFADGSCGDYECPSGRKRSWAINKQDLTHLNKCMDYLSQVEDPKIGEFKILDTLESSQCYKLVLKGEVKYLVEKYRPLFYDRDGNKKVPKQILNAPKNIKEKFMEGYIMGDGYKKMYHEQNRFNFCCKGKIGAQGLYYLCHAIGRTYLTLNLQKDKDDIYFVTQNSQKSRITDFNTIKKKIKIETTEYVYDIETDEGYFNGGVGQIVHFNTDSLFLQLPSYLKNDMTNREKLLKSIEISLKLEKQIQPTMKKPQNLEYEKTFFPFVLFTKKRYASLKYEFDPDKPQLNWMGICLTRREYPQCIKKIYRGILDKIFYQSEMSKEERIGSSIDYLKDELRKIINGEYPIEDFIQSKTLNASYKSETVAHYELVQRIKKRSPGVNIQINDRIPFVFVETEDPNALDKDRIEDPDYIKEQGLQIDYRHYIKNVIAPPICQLYALCLDDIEYEQKHYFKRYIESYAQQQLLAKPDMETEELESKVQSLKADIVMKNIFDPFILSNHYRGIPIQSLKNFLKNGTCIPRTKLTKEELKQYQERVPKRVQPEPNEEED